jgi:hypothetical protein
MYFENRIVAWSLLEGYTTLDKPLKRILGMPPSTGKSRSIVDVGSMRNPVKIRRDDADKVSGFAKLGRQGVNM